MICSGSGEFSGTAENTSGFGQLKSGKPSTLPVLSQTKTQLLDQTTQSNMELFGSTSAASVIGQNGQTPIVPKLEGYCLELICKISNKMLLFY